MFVAVLLLCPFSWTHRPLTSLPCRIACINLPPLQTTASHRTTVLNPLHIFALVLEAVLDSITGHSACERDGRELHSRVRASTFPGLSHTAGSGLLVYFYWAPRAASVGVNSLWCEDDYPHLYLVLTIQNKWSLTSISLAPLWHGAHAYTYNESAIQTMSI